MGFAVLLPLLWFFAAATGVVKLTTETTAKTVDRAIALIM
jgi:hypothetical protein